MRMFSDHPRARWAVPAAAVAVIAGGSLLATRTASADSGLPNRTAAQLLVDVRTSSERSLSGTVVQTANLGLPELSGLSKPGAGTSSGASLTSMLSGTHTWRVWADGPTKARVALVGGSGESDVIRNGPDVWVWSSQDKTAAHHTLDPKDTTPGAPSGGATSLPSTPDQAAQQALAAIEPTTNVTTAGTAKVAGRDAYELVLDPKSTATKVAQVRIAVDADTHVPLRVQVFSSKAANPAFEVGFTSVDFATPEARQFAFTPPPGTTVTEGDGAAAAKAPTPAAAKPKIVGTGWERVVVATLPAQAAQSTGATQQQLQGVLSAIPKVSGAWGSGRVIDGTLFSAVIADDGRIAVGAVAPDALYAALSAK